MKCIVCKHGELAPGTATYTTDTDGVVMVLRNVPALVCDTCGEEYFEQDVCWELDDLVEQAGQAGPSLEVREYGREA
jgi:YgiT-type zinc finger domain-containing protein